MSLHVAAELLSHLVLVQVFWTELELTVPTVLLHSCLATPKGQRSETEGHLDVVDRLFRKRSLTLRLKIPVGIISVWGPSL